MRAIRRRIEPLGIASLALKAERTFDQKEIGEVWKQPRVIRAIRDDNYVDVEYPVVDSLIYLKLFEEDLAGVLILTPENSITVNGHFAMLPEYFGRAKEGLMAGIGWVKENTNFKKITGRTPVFNKLAIKVNLEAGFDVEGINKASFLRNGKLYDQIYFGIEV